MNVCGIVSEYNPFHRGHEFHIEKTREVLGDDTLIVSIMSGNFVQRGECAIMDKFSRAEAAVSCGADLVIELPLIFATASAEGFARGAVAIANACGIISHLSFGCEDADIVALYDTARILLSAEFADILKKHSSSGTSFAKARENAVCEISEKSALILQKPNNILAVEYIKALLESGSAVSPIAIQRKSVSHDDMTCKDGFASASYLRSLIMKNDISASAPFIPKRAYEIIEKTAAAGACPMLLSNQELAVIAHLRRMSPEEFLSLPDSTEGLGYRLMSEAKNASSLEDLYDRVKTKRYAHARIRRMVLYAYLGISADMMVSPPRYLRVLAFNENGRKLLSDMNDKASLPVMIKPAEIKKLPYDASDIFSLEARATDIFNLSRPDKAVIPCGEEYRKSPIYVK